MQRQTDKSRAGRHVEREAGGRDGHEGGERQDGGGNIFQRPHENSNGDVVSRCQRFVKMGLI